MWFAALDPSHTGWLGPLLRRLLEGEPAVLDLLDAPEWKTKPPRYVRLRYYRYEFTDAGAATATGAWWRRQPIGMLTQRLSLEDIERMDRRPASRTRAKAVEERPLAGSLLDSRLESRRYLPNRQPSAIAAS